MIDVMDAIKKSTEFLDQLSSLSGSTTSINDVRVEEVELSRDDNFWIVTLGWNDYAKAKRPTTMAQLAGAATEYVWTLKTFYISVEDGSITKMMIRDINDD